MIGSAYLAAEGYEAPLAEELTRRRIPVDVWHGRLALSPAPPPSPNLMPAWALDVWTAPRPIAVPSIRAGANALRALQRNWSLYPVHHHRRATLIEALLPPVAARPLTFPSPPPAGHLGAWTLLDPAAMLASPAKTSPFVNGEVRFVEDRVGPPSRAYLKLWEALTRFGAWPAAGETCVDLGASPGGWTWALASLGARVVAVDKAPLDPEIAVMPGVTWRGESAWAMPPERVDWLFSDIIAYPARLLRLVRTWIEAAPPARIVCTVKFQGPTDHEAAHAFAAIEGGRVLHLSHNKHELTFLWQRP